MKNFVFVPEFTKIMAYIESRGLVSVIITNGHHKVQRDKLSACGAYAFFPRSDRIIVGGEELLKGRKEKPDASIFMQACKAAGCEPHEAIHVGDNLSTDIQVRETSLYFNLPSASHAFSNFFCSYLLGGNNAGLRATIWVNSHTKETITNKQTKPTYVVKTIGEVPAVIDHLMMHSE
ncbi:HAD hydrolase-like protein [Candidatus Dependentiae bacterium]|nr:HAD hydrolase-like protein [Candidatus Dependentiae bacterium]